MVINLSFKPDNVTHRELINHLLVLEKSMHFAVVTGSTSYNEKLQAKLIYFKNKAITDEGISVLSWK